MNEKEKQAIEFFKKSLKKKTPPYWYDDTLFNIEKKIKIILNLTKKQQKEIESRLKEIDSLYKMMSAKDDEIEYLAEKIAQMRLDYNILKDDIEGHNVVYVDTPEFEENYISKDKIRELKEKVEKEMISNPYDFSYMINKLLGE